MKVLVACEFSGRVRDAFLRAGHDAISCDLMPTEREGPHYQGDVRKILQQKWDLMVAHPPCTFLAVSGARWFSERLPEQRAALRFVKALMQAPIKRIAIENPVSIISTKIRPPDQIFCPTDFGTPVTKRTCLWLKNLPPLKSTMKVLGNPTIHYMGGENRNVERSRTFFNVANAMAAQWGKLEK